MFFCHVSTCIDCNKQLVLTFLRDLDTYFELKKVAEKLPLVLRAIKDPSSDMLVLWQICSHLWLNTI